MTLSPQAKLPSSNPVQDRPTIQQADSSVHYIGRAAPTPLAGIAVNFPDGGRIHLVAADSSNASRAAQPSLRICFSTELSRSSPAVEFKYSVAGAEGRDLSGPIIERVGISELPFGVSRMILNRVAAILAEEPSTAAALVKFEQLTAGASDLASTLKSLASSDAKSTNCSGRSFQRLDAMAPTTTTDIGILFSDGSTAIATVNDPGLKESLVVTTISAAGEMRNFLIRSLKQDLPKGPLLYKSIFTAMKDHGSTSGLADAFAKEFVMK